MTGSAPFVIGLTGSIGMGKTTTAKMFADEGVQVWDADEAVDRLYAKGGAAVAVIAQLYAPAIQDGSVNRDELRRWITKDKTALKRLESAVHPLVATDRAAFLESATSPVVVLDIPLLFETGLNADLDMVVVVTAPADVQRKRVMQRPEMTEATFKMILSKQMPDQEKRKRADIVISTLSLEAAREAVQNLINGLREKLANA